MSKLYNFEYYHYNCGPIPYEQSERWMEHFGKIADHIINELHPKTVLDAGCAMGYLVAALRDRGVEAYGIDISEYAISKVREDIKPFCVVGSLTEPLPKELPCSYDLVITIEVLEHLYEKEGLKAIENICKLSECIVFSSTPDDVTEPTHFNVQQREYWVKHFWKHGFAHNLYFDMTWCTPDAMLFQKDENISLEQIVFDYEHNARLLDAEIKSLQKQYGTTTQIISILIDDGGGYKEEERIYSCHTPETPYVNIGITVPFGGKTVCIEPVKGYACLVSDIVVQPCEEGTFIQLKEHNGIKIGNSFLFETMEPMLLYEVMGKTPAVFQIIATVTVFPTLLVCKQVQSMLNSEREEIKQLKEQYDNKEKKYNVEIEQLKEQCTSKEKNYNIEIEQLKEQCDSEKKQKQYYQLQEERLYNLLDEKESEIVELSQKMKMLNKLQDEFANTELEKKTLEARMNTANVQLQQMLQEILVLREELEGLQNSTCWRMTKPLRNVIDFCRGNRTSKQGEEVKKVEQNNQKIEDKVDINPNLMVNVEVDTSDMLPESLFSNREKVGHVVERLSKYDVISFDIFDTLIFRIFDKPTDVFRMLGHRIGEESFAKLRIQAEQEARKVHSEINGEVNIYEIYEILEKYLMINKEELIKEELQAEKDCCFANGYLKNVFDELIQREKKVILVSDMYLPKKMLQELLESCGYSGYDNLYVSCEYRYGKGSGKLQKIAEMDNSKAKKIIHIGDNYISDIECSQKIGWDTMYYPSCHSLGNSLRPKEMNRLSASVYKSMVNIHLHSDDLVYSAEYEHGFRYAGFLVCGFCEWLNQYAKENCIDKIFFLARDADILYKVYNKHYYEVENEYVVTSRLAMWEMTFETNPEEFIQNFFLSRANIGIQTLKDALQETDLENLIPLLKEDGLCAESCLTKKNYEMFHDFLMTHYSEIVKHFSDSKKAGQQYLKGKVGNAKKICAVDIGWSGQILITMKKIIDEMFDKNVRIQGAYMAVTDSEATSGYVESRIITPYLFHGCMNRDIAINTATIEGDMQAKFMEATFTSDQPTLLKYDYSPEGELELVYGMQTANIKHLHEMQKGIMDFADLWQENTKYVKSFLQIMPADAKNILDSAIKNFRYCYAIFGDNLEWDVSLPNYKGQETITTLGEMLKKRGLITK